MNNLGQFLRASAQQHHERIAYAMTREFRTERFTFADVYVLALKTASFLQSCSLKKGETLAIWSLNMPEYPILYFGCWLLGIIAVPIDVRTTEETLHRFVTRAACTLGFVEPSLMRAEKTENVFYGNGILSSLLYYNKANTSNIYPVCFSAICS